MNVNVLLWLIPPVCLLSCNGDRQPAKPNILLILADDMGYSDLGCFGGEIHTPNLDNLAGNGIRFTQFYNTARCCPTRASLITGLYPHETGVGHLTGRTMGPGYLGYLNDSCYTIAEILGEYGYFTAMAGKWHVGNVKDAWPENRGFQRFFGIHNYVDSYFKVLEDCQVYENGMQVIPAAEFPELYAEKGKEWYTTDVFTSKAIQYIDEALEKGMPFFQYLAYNAPHWPLEAHDSVIDEYRHRYKEGYEELRKEKYERMIRMGLLQRSWALPNHNLPPWELLPDSVKADTRFRRAIYAAQVEIMDRNIGKIISHLEEKGMLDNTLIIFLSDNGCSAEPENIDFGYQWGINTLSNYPEWRRNSARAGASQGLVWSVASNSPFRLYKKFCHEGGISTPLIMHWPEGIKNPGSLDNKPGHLIDIMATILELTGAKYPSTREGIPVKPLQGISLANNLKGLESREHDYLFWEHEGHGALRMGNWKIVTVNVRDPESWELYDMESDRTETHDLSAEKTVLRQEMISKWLELAVQTLVIPWPDRENAKNNPVDK